MGQDGWTRIDSCKVRWEIRIIVSDIEAAKQRTLTRLMVEWITGGLKSPLKSGSTYGAQQSPKGRYVLTKEMDAHRQTVH